MMLATPTTAKAKLAEETKKSYVFKPHVGCLGAWMTPLTSCTQPDCLSRLGSKLKSPASSHGPFNSDMAAATECRMSKLAWDSPSQSRRYTQTRCKPPLQTEPSHRMQNLATSASGSNAFTGCARPRCPRTAMATPELTPSFAVTLAGPPASLHP